MNDAITVLKSNVPHGPFTRAEVASQLAGGEITLDSLAFVEGLTQWTPLRDVLARFESSERPAVLAPSVTTMPVASGYGTPVTTAGTAIAADYSYAATMQPPGHLVYAGFWLRVVAYLIDTILLTAISAIIGMIVGFVVGLVMGVVNRDALAGAVGVAQVLMFLFTIVLVWLYFALMEASSLQATLGKMAIGLRVTDRQGQRIGFARATGRFFGKFISGIVLYVGFMMAGWTQRKQALHDMMADTLVVRK